MPFDRVPGTVVHHAPAAGGQYVGCPSIAVLPDGTYIASHSHFGPQAANTDSLVYRSADRGATWKEIAALKGQIWSNLFCHRDALYIMGTDHCDRYGGRLNGRLVIRRSGDGGLNWTDPDGPDTGLLSDHDGYHTAPMPVLAHRGRLWRAVEYAPVPERLHWRVQVLSVDQDADLLDRGAWTFSEMLAHSESRTQWIEGNMAVAPDGTATNLLRTNYQGKSGERATGYTDRGALVRVSEDGRRLVHDPDLDVVNMPGGGSKFTVRRDDETGLYCALVNKQSDPPARRNRLYLVTSPDLRRWTTRRLLLAHPDTEKHAFQYVDWVFDGRDIAYVSRTAHHDGEADAHNFHDANFLTFHAIEDFRQYLT